MMLSMSIVGLAVFGLAMVSGLTNEKGNCGFDGDFNQFIVKDYDANKKFCIAFSSETNQKSFKDARAYCKRFGATLALPKDKEMNNFLKDNIVSTGRSATWIGLNDMAKEKVFYWDDGEKQRGFNAFDVSEGKWNYNIFKYQEDCVGLKETGKWHDFLCYYKHPFICQKYEGKAYKVPSYP